MSVLAATTASASPAAEPPADIFDAAEEGEGELLSFVFESWCDLEALTSHRSPSFTFAHGADDPSSAPTAADGSIEVRQGEFEHTKTSDRTGAVVWDDAVVLARYIEHLGVGGAFFGSRRCVELGAGTGLLSLVLGCQGARVLTTEQPSMMGLLTANVAANAEAVVARFGGSVTAVPHFWGDDVGALLPEGGEPFDFIICSGVVYHPEATPALLQSLERLASPHRTVLLLAVDFRFEPSSEGFVLPVLEDFLAALRLGWDVCDVEYGDVLPVAWCKKSVTVFEATWRGSDRDAPGAPLPDGASD